MKNKIELSLTSLTGPLYKYHNTQQQSISNYLHAVHKFHSCNGNTQ